MPTAAGAWVPILDGSGWERFTTEDGVMRRQFKGVDDDAIAKHAAYLRSEIAAGRGEGGNMAFHMPAWLLSTIEERHKVNEMPMHQRKKWWKKFEATDTGQTYKVRGI